MNTLIPSCLLSIWSREASLLFPNDFNKTQSHFMSRACSVGMVVLVSKVYFARCAHKSISWQLLYIFILSCSFMDLIVTMTFLYSWPARGVDSPSPQYVVPSLISAGSPPHQCVAPRLIIGWFPASSVRGSAPHRWKRPRLISASSCTFSVVVSRSRRGCTLPLLRCPMVSEGPLSAPGVILILACFPPLFPAKFCPDFSPYYKTQW